MMGHELTALYGIDHARTLAIITPSHYRYNLETKKEKLAQYGERVWNISEGTVEEKAKAAIVKTEEFLHSLDIKTTLKEYTEDYEGTAETIAQRFVDRGWKGLGEHRNLAPEDVEKSISIRIEEAVQDLEGVKQIASRSQEGSSAVNICLLYTSPSPRD